MFALPDRLTFHLKNPTLFSRKTIGFFTNTFQEHFVHSALVYDLIGQCSILNFSKMFCVKKRYATVFSQPQYLTKIIMQLTSLIISEKAYTGDYDFDQFDGDGENYSYI